MREKEGLGRSLASQCGGWVDLRSFAAGVVAMGFIVVFHETVQYTSHSEIGSAPAVSIPRAIEIMHYIDDEDDRVQRQRNRMDRSGQRAACDNPPPPSRSYREGDHSTAAPIRNEINGSARPHDIDDDADREATPREDDELRTRRTFRAHGKAAALFVEMGAYRGGATSFAVVGLASKPIHVYGNAAFECEWVPADEKVAAVKGAAEKMLPDWNMGRQYTVVVVNCTFQQGVGEDRQGGQLVLYASYGDGPNYGDGRVDQRPPERIVALREAAGEYDARAYAPPYPYDFVYCGSPLYGELQPQRVREWMAYHAWLLGPRSHFILYDAGGVGEGVRRALLPWRRAGYVTLFDVRQLEQYDGYYHNQFLIVNDCFHRSRFLTQRWTFFFDVDEFLYVPPAYTLPSVMDRFSNYTQIMFLQKPMSPTLCQPRTNRGSDLEEEEYQNRWAMEKLVYRNIQAGITWDRKYAIQPRNAFATGIHRSDHTLGPSLGYFPDSIVPKLRYYHFHATLTHHPHSDQRHVCKDLPAVANATAARGINTTEHAHPLYLDSSHVPFTLDTGLQRLAATVKQFELQQIGPQPSVIT